MLIFLSKVNFLYPPIPSDRGSRYVKPTQHSFCWIPIRIIFLELLGRSHKQTHFSFSAFLGLKPHVHVSVAAAIQGACVRYLETVVHHESTPSSITPVSSSTYAAWSIRSPKPCPHIPYFPSVVLRLYIPGMSPDFTLVDSSSSL